MKRFDKGYIYCGLLTDVLKGIVIVWIFLKDIFLDEEANPKEFISVLPIFLVAFAVIYLCFVIYRILYYRTSGYELTETEIKCQYGVLFKKRSVLDYKKVHAINKKQNLIQRIFGIATLTVDSGSTNTSHDAEITVIENAKVIDALVIELNALKEGGARTVNEPKEEVLLSENDSLYNFTSKKKMLYTLINIVSTVMFFAVIGVLAITVIGICKLLLQLEGLGTWGEYFLVATLISVAALLIISFFVFIGCMVNAFVGYYNFNVTKRSNDIQISFGLLERHTNTFSYDRIKAVKISQGLVQRMLGFATIKLEVIGYTNSSGDDNNGADIGVLVPFCKYDEVAQILSKVLPDYVPDEKQTKSPSFLPFMSWFTVFWGITIGAVLLIAVAILLMANVSATVIWTVVCSVLGAGLLVLVIKLISAALCYQTSGIAAGNGKITAYHGGFIKNITVLMAKNLIAVEDVTTSWRKKRGIASLIMHVKTNALSNEVKVHIQKDELFEELEKMLTV